MDQYHGDAYSLGRSQANALCQEDADSWGGLRRTEDAIRERALPEIERFSKGWKISFSPEQQSQFIAGFIKGYTERRDSIDDYRARGDYPEIWHT